MCVFLQLARRYGVRSTLTRLRLPFFLLFRCRLFTAVFKEVDVNDSGDLSFDEFLQMLCMEARNQHLEDGWPLEKLSYKFFGYRE